jgi:hypothetical protein
MKVRTLCWTTAVFAGAAGMALTPASAQKPAKPGKPQKPVAIEGPVSITAKPNPLVFGTATVVSGRVRNALNDTTVTLLRRTLPSDTFSGTATVTVDRNGSYSFTQRPPRNTYYRAVSSLNPSTQSGDLLVRVSMLVGFRVSDSTPRSGQRVRFSGIVRPAHNGRTASIQRTSATGSWVTIARPVLRAVDAGTSRYRRTLRVRGSHTYRVRVLGHSDHAQGVSRERMLATH